MIKAVTGTGNNFLNKAGLKSIQSGEILSVKILENKGSLAKVSLKGMIVMLRTEDVLAPGATIKVRAQWSGKTLYLNKPENNSADIFFKAAGIENNLSAHLLIDTAARAGLSIKENTIKLIKKLLRRRGCKDLDKETARLAVEAIKKGLSPENILGAAGLSGRDDDTADHEKTILFNQLKSGDELWYIVPYKFSVENTEIKGSLRIKKNLTTDKIDTTVIEAGLRENRLFFLIKNYGKKNMELKIFSEKKLNSTIKRKIKKNLAEIQGNLKLKIDDNITEECFSTDKDYFFDGFSMFSSESSGFETIV